jgi:hypothetical protein
MPSLLVLVPLVPLQPLHVAPVPLGGSAQPHGACHRGIPMDDTNDGEGALITLW